MARLSETKAAPIVHAHAIVCGVSWGQVRVKKLRTWYFRLTGYSIEVESEDGVFRANVPANIPCVVWCEYQSTDPNGFLIPPWLTCPPWVNQVSMHWRMGGGEYYLCRWFKWFRSLPREQQNQYIDRFGVTDREGWESFWDTHRADLLQPKDSSE